MAGPNLDFTASMCKRGRQKSMIVRNDKGGAKRAAGALLHSSLKLHTCHISHRASCDELDSSKTSRLRPRRIVNGDQMARLREQGASFREIAKAVGASPG